MNRFAVITSGISFTVAAGLEVSGYENQWLAIAFFCISGLLFVVAMVSYLLPALQERLRRRKVTVIYVPPDVASKILGSSQQQPPLQEMGRFRRYVRKFLGLFR